jgi:hypothetical protein
VLVQEEDCLGIAVASSMYTSAILYNRAFIPSVFYEVTVDSPEVDKLACTPTVFCP